MRDRLQLPPLHLPAASPSPSPITSERVADFQEYAQWDRQRKQAYRDQLRAEILEHDRTRETQQREKDRERQEINDIVRLEADRSHQDRHLKIKTEQKYMHDNWTLLQQSQRLSPHSRPQLPPSPTPADHPFVRLVDQQDQRSQDTKRNFIFQNKLNDLQSEMRRAQAERRREFETQERRRLDEHVEDQYRKKRREREVFENKYLRIDKTTHSDCKKDYLDYLKAQASLARSHSRNHPNHQQDALHEINRASPGHIGLSPASFDRIKQLQTVEKSLKLFQAPRDARNNHSTLDYRQHNPEDRPKLPAYEKVLTERAAPTIEHLSSEPFETLPIRQISSRAYPLQPQLSERLEKPVRTPKPYKQYNIINGTERLFLH